MMKGQTQIVWNLLERRLAKNNITEALYKNLALSDTTRGDSALYANIVGGFV